MLVRLAITNLAPSLKYDLKCIGPADPVLTPLNIIHDHTQFSFTSTICQKNGQLSLAILSHELAMLIALSSADRCSEFTRLVIACR